MVSVEVSGIVVKDYLSKKRFIIADAPSLSFPINLLTGNLITLIMAHYD